jgi:hypothetical protein
MTMSNRSSQQGDPSSLTQLYQMIVGYRTTQPIYAAAPGAGPETLLRLDFLAQPDLNERLRIAACFTIGAARESSSLVSLK